MRGQTCPHGILYPQGLLHPPFGEICRSISGVSTMFLISGCFLHAIGKPTPTRSDSRSCVTTCGQRPWDLFSIKLALPSRYIPCWARDNKTLVRFDDLRNPIDAKESAIPSSRISLRTREMITTFASSPCDRIQCHIVESDESHVTHKDNTFVHQSQFAYLVVIDCLEGESTFQWNVHNHRYWSCTITRIGYILLL